MWIELIKTIGLAILSPILIAYASIQIAKFHFEKEMKAKYLLAKDATAVEILNSICLMLNSMWELANINSWITAGTASATDPNIVQRRQSALQENHRAIMASYLQLGKIGLYYGTEIVDLISELLSDLNMMVFTSDFSVFSNAESWRNFRRSRLLPVLQQVHLQLRDTVFEKIKSFHLIVS